jgi:signal transduction histidine kinase
VIVNSLKFRLLFAWIAFIALSLVVSGIGLRYLYERGITRWAISELEADLKQLRRGFEISSEGEGKLLRPPTDPQFETVFGGRYWQIFRNGKPFLRSASLGEQNLDVGNIGAAARRKLTLSGPDQQKLIGVMRMGALKGGAVAQEFSFLTALDSAEITEDANTFLSDIILGLTGLAALLIAGAWAQVAIGLKPLEALRSGLASVRGGTARTIEGDFPTEILPLIDETNALLTAQDVSLEAARARAGDLAHGLKTPLAIMAGTSRDLREIGHTAASDEIDGQIQEMRRHIDRELARVRARGKSSGRNCHTDLSLSAQELVVVFKKLPTSKDMLWEVQLPPNVAVAIDQDDLNNILGNLLDNANKWAASRIRVGAHVADNAAVLTVEDDGPGVEPTQFDRIVQRGERNDPSVEGSGLGLAIVSDLVELNGGQLTIGRSKLGGLKATIVLPAARM